MHPRVCTHSGQVFCLSLAALIFAFSSMSSVALAQSSVHDETGLMNQDAVAHIEARNDRLINTTGEMVFVVVQHGNNGETSADASAIATKLAARPYAAVVWVATAAQHSDIVFASQGVKWIPLAKQDALRLRLANEIAFCCPSDEVPRIVDAIADETDADSQIAPNPRNYIHDDLGLLSSTQAAAIVAREQQLESATGKGIGVVLIMQTTKLPAIDALSRAAASNVRGEISAVVWAARNGGTITFDMVRVPAQTQAMADSTADNINASFQADMQSGQLGEAIVAAVDRTAAALQGTATPMPASQAVPIVVTSPSAFGSSEIPQPGASQPQGIPARGSGSRTISILLVLLVFAAAIVVLIVALRRQNA